MGQETGAMIHERVNAANTFSVIVSLSSVVQPESVGDLFLSTTIGPLHAITWLPVVPRASRLLQVCAEHSRVPSALILLHGRVEGFGRLIRTTPIQAIDLIL